MNKIIISLPLDFFTIPLPLTQAVRFTWIFFTLPQYNSQTMTCICHTDIIPGVDVGVAVYYRYTAEVRENVTNKQYVLKFAKAHQKYFPQNLSILLPSKIFCSDSVKDDFLLSNIFSSISNFYLLYFENTSKDGPKIYSFSKSYINMGSSIPA